MSGTANICFASEIQKFMSFFFCKIIRIITIVMVFSVKKVSRTKKWLSDRRKYEMKMYEHSYLKVCFCALRYVWYTKYALQWIILKHLTFYTQEINNIRKVEFFFVIFFTNNFSIINPSFKSKRRSNSPTVTGRRLTLSKPQQSWT